MIVLDASFLIAHFDDTDDHHAQAGEMLVAFGDEELRAGILTLAEVLVGPARHGRVVEAEWALAELGVESQPLGDLAGRELALRRVDTGLKLPDCCVLLAAEATGAAIATFDHALASAARRRGVAVIGRPSHST